MSIRGFNKYLPQERVSPSNPLLNRERPRQDGAHSANVVIQARPGNMLEIIPETGSAIADWTLQDADSPITNDVDPNGMVWPVCEAGLIFFYAGTGTVRVREWTYEMGLIRAAALRGTAGGGSSSPTANQNVSNAMTTPLAAVGPIFSATQIPDSAIGKEYLIQSAPVQVAAGVPPFSNYGDSLICVADTEAKAEAGEGTYIAPGGTITFTGETWVCEVGHVDGGGESDSCLFYTEIA